MHLDTIALIVSFLLNILISAYGIMADRQAFSLNSIFWIFTLLFLSFIPFGQYLLGHFPWGRSFSNLTLLSANGLILFCSVVYAVVRQKINNKMMATISVNTTNSKPTTTVIIMYCLSCLLLIALSNGGRFWERGNGVSISNSTAQLLIDKSLRGICLYGLLMSIHFWKEQKISLLVFISMLLIGFIANFPTAIPRYWLATFYLAGLLVIWKKRFVAQRYLFSTLVVGITIVAFPILSIFRYNAATIKTKFDSLSDIFSFSYSGGDFDAYTSFCSTIDYVNTQGITWGKQLGTVLLFFVPRSVWSGKGIGSGALVNQLPNSDFSNFCSPYIAEGYINFGIIGSVLFIILLAVFITQYDRLYWCSEKSTYTTIFYPAAIGMLFFVLRGDLLSSFAYSVGIYTAGCLVHYGTKRLGYFKNNK
ncbi:MAG: hypothetical protein QM530_01675 [Phycisphaerales bacterium]|nr:hypothetical protein [Phycisphaerales bacterium]